jgi:hypothetical protein
MKKQMRPRVKNEITDGLNHLSRALRRVHKIFLDGERTELEMTTGQKLQPLDFFNKLTQDPELAWMKTFSGLMAEIDEFIDEAEAHTDGDLKKFRDRVNFTLLHPGSKISTRYLHYLATDPDFVLAHAELRLALGPPPNDD